MREDDVMTDTASPCFVPDRMPEVSDRKVWDAYLSVFHMPSVAASDQLGLFDRLASAPATPAELAGELDLKLEALKALLPLLSALGFLEVEAGRYRLSAHGQAYLVKSSPFYWGHAFSPHHASSVTQQVLNALRSAGAGVREGSPAEGWETGQIDPQMARMIAAFMNSHSVPTALAVAQQAPLRDVRHLLDVGGGSGCFAIAIARANPAMRATIMELPAMCAVAEEYIEASGLAGRVGTVAVDMFRQDWPTGHDSAFFSNVFHDWSWETNAQLAARAFSSLPSGGTIHLNEMLIDDDGYGPLVPACFSMMMRVGTRGRQYSAAELAEILEGAGFTGISVTGGYAYHSLVSARKP
jgi:acetylserotonin N-methyltransferase